MNNSNKKILCYNIITYKTCAYGNKCNYAHSLKEQIISEPRKYLYSIIKDPYTNLSNLNLTNNPLLNEMIVLSKTCLKCQINECSGGYNCRYGAINSNYRLCYDNFYNGNCMNKICPYNGVHLTNNGLIPFIYQLNNNNYIKLESLNSSIWKNPPKSLYLKTMPSSSPPSSPPSPLLSLPNSDLNYSINGSKYVGKLLSDSYLINNYSELSDTDEEFIEYLNSDDDPPNYYSNNSIIHKKNESKLI